TDVDEGTQENTAPVFSSASSASIEENITITTVILDVEATDGDGGAVDQNVTYTLSGVDAEDFSIDSDDGEIRFVSVPDFENPTDDGGNNVYNITVTADDGESENNTSEQSITITVTDVDEGTPNVAPIFSSVSSVAIAENIPITMIVLDVNATDGDGGEIDQNIRYTISGVDSEDFAIDSDDGEIRFVSVPDFENPLDNGSDNVYNLMVTADDGEAINNTNVQAIMITVTDVDEGTQNIAPVFSSLSSVMVAENLPATTIVLDVNATDGDGGAVDENVTYSLSGIDAGNFTIDDNNGEIRLVSILDFEKPSDVDQDNMYDFTVTADDGELENNKTTMSVTVTVSDVDDEEQPLSIEDGNFNLLIYGNTERLYIRYAGEAAAQVAIYELTGKVVFDDTAHFINHETVIQPSLQIGQVYILMINTESVKFKIYK
ncbi:MAG: cadherin repeat domain-containing protein, partial [Cyclobacteriaceae bacterium]|nr:cadherin repeat domain-containing protein [Cyclobacteriaceae bacterium HetDA_MAG_MS6]